ncbi:mannosyl-oligosaccharide alpha-1,2-mannosidase [Tulasnella sp. 418]|nr:mannosyl-oligosaccharide alpha-1,2-mannosidase [Tulasnella sp. 418]
MVATIVSHTKTSKRKNGLKPASGKSVPQAATPPPNAKAPISPLKVFPLLLIPIALSALVILYSKGGLRIISPATRTSVSKLRPPRHSEPRIIKADESKRNAVVNAFKHAWSAYERDAFGDDNYHPVSGRGSNLTWAGSIGYMITDSIDTLMIMGLDEEYNRAREWIANDLSFDRDGSYNTFETTIRVLGGLLSAHHLSASKSPSNTPDPIYLERAVDLANRLLPAFDSPSGIPYPIINLDARQGFLDEENDGLASTAEVSTLQLELKYLTWLTGDNSYWKAAEKITRKFRRIMQNGLAPTLISPTTGLFTASEIKLGTKGDSYYEYLLKQYIQTNRTELVYRDMYDESMTAIHSTLVQVTPTGKLTYTSELHPATKGELHEVAEWKLVPKQDQLVCYMAGLLMLGAVDTGSAQLGYGSAPERYLFTDVDRRDWKLGEDLIRTCMATHDTVTGLPPEIAHFRTKTDPDWVARLAPSDWYIKGLRDAKEPYDARYILRPETVESLFVAYRLTGAQKYRDWGWKIFQAIERYCRIENGGYSGVINVDQPDGGRIDRMETFFLSETLKYLYLLFDDGDVLPFKEVVFNTEGHPFPIFQPRSDLVADFF